MSDSSRSHRLNVFSICCQSVRSNNDCWFRIMSQKTLIFSGEEKPLNIGLRAIDCHRMPLFASPFRNCSAHSEQFKKVNVNVIWNKTMGSKLRCGRMMMLSPAKTYFGWHRSVVVCLPRYWWKGRTRSPLRTANDGSFIAFFQFEFSTKEKVCKHQSSNHRLNDPC